jgi:hypothetical protein
VILINPYNGTKYYRTIVTENDAELFGLRVDSNTGKLYSVQMSSFAENPVSIVQIDRTNFIAKRWVNITNVDGISSDPLTVFSNSTNYQCFAVVVSGIKDILVGIDLMKPKIISEISNANLPSYLCYDNKTNAFYGMQTFKGKRGCCLIRFNPYNGTAHVLSEDFNDYEPSAGTCYEGYYFTMIVLNVDTQKILTFNLHNNGKLLAKKLEEEYLLALAFIPT